MYRQTSDGQKFFGWSCCLLLPPSGSIAPTDWCAVRFRMSRRLTRRQSRERGLLPSAAYASILKQISFLATGYAPQVARRPLKRMIFTAWSIACRFLKVFSNQALVISIDTCENVPSKAGGGERRGGHVPRRSAPLISRRFHRLATLIRPLRPIHKVRQTSSPLQV